MKLTSVRCSAFALVAALALASSGLTAQPRPTPGQQPAQQPAPTGAQRFELRPSGISRVAFTSDAPLETIDGVSTNTTGNFSVDLANPGRGLTGRVQLTTASLRTGNDTRDEHLRSGNWLDATRFPDITLELLGTSLNTALRPGVPARGTLRARLTLHGVSHDLTVPVTVRHVPLSQEHAQMAQFGINADMLRVQSEFTVRLSDYGVSIMLPLQLKVSNEIRIRADLTAFRAQG